MVDLWTTLVPLVVGSAVGPAPTLVTGVRCARARSRA